MSLLEKLTEDMKAAMKERAAGKKKLSVIRMVRSSLKNAEIEKKQGLTEDEVIEVIAREVKKRKESCEEYLKAGRQDIAEGLQEEVAILMNYLPEQMSEDQIRSLVEKVMAEVQPASPKDMGKVMGRLMPKVKGKADGKLVSSIVKELLEQ
ncbi:MAG: aspartyl-tRNA amidotransferase [Firmicutes bacterium HGW-Firmicutes-14]|nr:MAG: aspartyl-tRNA amidotransferase [Firmicutes bacterium HGW-Firmicutes-14]